MWMKIETHSSWCEIELEDEAIILSFLCLPLSFGAICLYILYLLAENNGAESYIRNIGRTKTVWSWRIWRFGLSSYRWGRAKTTSETREALHIDSCRQGVLSCTAWYALSFISFVCLWSGIKVFLCVLALPKGYRPWHRRVYCYWVQTSWDWWDSKALCYLSVSSISCVGCKFSFCFYNVVQ